MIYVGVEVHNTIPAAWVAARKCLSFQIGIFRTGDLIAP
jgi:hypothetical protein